MRDKQPARTPSTSSVTFIPSFSKNSSQISVGSVQSPETPLDMQIINNTPLKQLRKIVSTSATTTPRQSHIHTDSKGSNTPQKTSIVMIEFPIATKCQLREQIASKNSFASFKNIEKSRHKSITSPVKKT